MATVRVGKSTGGHRPRGIPVDPNYYRHHPSRVAKRSMAEMRPSGGTSPLLPQDPQQPMVQAGVWCEKCNNRLVELKRQVLRLILPEIQGYIHSGNTPNAGSLSTRIFGQIHLPDTHLKSWQNEHCLVCSTHLNQLKWEAISMVHTLEESQFLAYYNIPGYVVGPNTDQLLRRIEKDKQRHPGNATTEHGDRGLLYARPEDGNSTSFFHRAAQKLNLSSKKKSKKHHVKESSPAVHDAPVPSPRHAQKESSPYPFPTKFKEVLRLSQPSAPPALLKTSKRTDGKVKVMLRVCPSFIGESASVMKVDTKRKQVTLYDPSTVSHVSHSRRKMGVAAPKMFAFDGIYEPDASQSEVCSGSLVDIIQTVVNGSDGCLFTYGHAGLGKTFTMMGRDESDQTIGVLPCALAWLFRLISDQKQKTGTKFSVRVSAVEIVGRSENWRDLLAATTSTENGTNETVSPSVFLREGKSGGMQLLNPSELRASSAEKAAFYLDAALAARTRPSGDNGPDGSAERDETKNSHMFFTVHIYRVEKHSKSTGVHGGRSRLHLIDLASCEGYTGSKKDGGASSMSIAGLGNVIIALINGAKHVPHKNSKITRMLQESIGNTSCRTTMIAHVSPSLPFYAETLSTVQLASRLHRLRKRKGKGSSSNSSGGESSCDESRIRKPRLRTAEPRVRTTAIPARLREDGPASGEGEDQSNSEQEEYNSSTGEESCDTVIYVGPDGELSDRDLTDHEGPPPVGRYSKTAGNTSWEESESTRSLKEKLDSIENQQEEVEDTVDKEQEINFAAVIKEVQVLPGAGDEPPVREIVCEGRTDGLELGEYLNLEESDSTPTSRETVAECFRGIKESISQDEIVERIKDTYCEEEFLEEIRELDSLVETLDQNCSPPSEPDLDYNLENREYCSQELDDSELSYGQICGGTSKKRELSGNSSEFSGDLTKDNHISQGYPGIPCQIQEYKSDTSSNKKRQSLFLSENVLLLGKGQELSERDLKETAKYALSKAEILLGVGSEVVEEAGSSSAQDMRYHKPSSRVIHVEAFVDNIIKPAHASKSSSSDASSSDAESIVLPEKPQFSFMTCDAINDPADACRKRGSRELLEMDHRASLPCCNITAQLVEACQPNGMYTRDNRRDPADEQHSPDEFYFDDTELSWSEKDEDVGTITVYYEDDRGQGVEIQHSQSTESFPDLDKQLSLVEPVQDGTEPELELRAGSNDSLDSDPELPPRSPAMDTPMQMFYHLVPSPQSSSTEEDCDDGMTSKSKTVKSLSPIPECPSRESSLNRSTESINIHEKRNRDSFIYVEVRDNPDRNTPVHEKDRDFISPPAKYFRTVDDVGSQTEPSEVRTMSPDKHELRSLLQRFVAEQLKECQVDGPPINKTRPTASIALDHSTSMPTKSTPTSMPRKTPNTFIPSTPQVGPTPPRRGNRRCKVISPSDSPGQDILLPPLMPQRRAIPETARVIRAPRLNSRTDRSCRSDIVCYSRSAAQREEYRDDSSESSAKTEPWSPHTARYMLPPPLPRPTTSVTFLGCEDATKSGTTVRPVESEADTKPGPVGKSDKPRNRNDTGYQSEPEIALKRASRRARKQNELEEKGYASESDGKRSSRDRCPSASNTVRLTYVGSEVSDSEADISDRKLRLHQSEPQMDRYGNLKRPTLSRERISPSTPYAPQVEFRDRQKQRSQAKLIYRLSGADFLEAMSSAMETTTTSTPTGSKVCVPSEALRQASLSTLKSGISSTSTVWIMSEPAISCGETTADERSVPGTPACVPRGKSISKLRLFSRDRGSCNSVHASRDRGSCLSVRDRNSYSSGHASDSSFSESPGPRQSRNRSLKRSKSASTRSETASSSGYESMRGNDTSHLSSDSCSERETVREKRRGFRRKRSNSAPPTNRRSRSKSPRRWFSRKSLDDQVEIKVYHVDDIEKLQRFMQAEANEERYQQLHGLRQQQGALKEELRRSKQRLIEDDKRWSYGLRAEQMFPSDDPRLPQALQMENTVLEKRIKACKSSLMMVTSFDLPMSTEV
ncbi:kinesin-like protein KIF26B isoform X2 [Nematostella vectensis]|uniref:kinesin-like protein KIF26B isoform X2 n=1 Tax=Nematostella vectensis TaxID=45351 RepID=UPI002076D827|nr:kinesin-like protein KIF26B isoform X2 [Nematostella vectensis]